MKSRTLLRATLAAFLLAAMPVATVTAVTATTTTAQRLANLKTKGAAEIDRRIANLSAALEKLTAGTKLTAADKATLTKQIQDEVTGLTALKTKLAADTDLAMTRTDVQSIVTEYRVYALMLPKARMAASADRFTVVEDKLTALHDELQTKVDAAKTAGKDTTAMQASLDDMKAKIASAKTKSGSLVTQLLALQPTDYNANHTVLAGYRDSLKGAHTDLKTARDDAKSVIDALKSAK
jgi:chromosome segregation ATPase